MVAEQKRAWLAVISGAVCVVLFAVLTPFFGAAVAMSAFALFAVNGLAGLIGRGEKIDERDRSIALRATLGGAMASYLTFVGALMGVWTVVYLLHGDSQVSVYVLPNIVFLGLLVLWIVRAVAILVYYGRHVEADDV